MGLQKESEIMQVYQRDFTADVPQWNGHAFLVVSPQELNQLTVNAVKYDDWGATAPNLSGRYLRIGYGLELPENTDSFSPWYKVPIEGIWYPKSNGELVALAEYPADRVFNVHPVIGKRAVRSNAWLFNHGCTNTAQVIHIGNGRWRVESAESCHSCWQVGHDDQYIFAEPGDVVYLLPYQLEPLEG